MQKVFIPKPAALERGITDYPKYKTNPFMQHLLYMKNTRNKIVASGKPLGVYDEQTGEIEQGKHLRSLVVERVDNEEFTKIYNNYLQVVFGLSPRGLKLFQYFVTALKFNDERVIFDHEEAMIVTGYSSRHTIGKGIAELIDAEIIARSGTQSIYYINPRVFVKGNRLDMVQIWVKKNTPEDIALVNEMKKRDEERKQLSLFNNEAEQ